MAALYVCLFSNDFVKVGRSCTPEMRIAQHADRLSCVGVTLVESYITHCSDNDEGREQALINRCVAAAKTRHQLEWFTGLSFREVCVWAYDAAHSDNPGQIKTEVDGKPDFRAIVNALRIRGWKQSDIAVACRCDQSSISDIATGKTQDPRYSVGSTLVKLAEENGAA